MRCRLLLSLFSLFLLSSALLAQKKELKVKYGKISEAEMAMKSYADDPAAPAVVLFDKGNITNHFNPASNFVLEFERHLRMKIFRKEASSLADIPIFYYKWQKVINLQASSYNLENGKLVETELGKENVFDEELTRTRLVKKVTIPAVREGSIIELRYTIVDDRAIGLFNWIFQRVDVPTLWSEYEASVPTFIQYGKMAQGEVPFSLAEESERDETTSFNLVDRDQGMTNTQRTTNVQVFYTTKRMHFIQENVPSLKPEPFIGSPNDYLSQLNFDVQAVYDTKVVPEGSGYKLINGGFRERNASWEKLGEEMLEDVYRKVLKSSKYTEDAAAACTIGKSTDAEKVAAVYAFVGTNYQRIDMDYIWKTQTLEQLTQNRKGSPTDLNLLLINMLRHTGIKAYPVLFSTRSNGRVLPYRVSTDGMNRVIAAVELEPGNPTLVDLAGWPNPLGLLPEEDLNEKGLVLKSEDDISWIPLQNKVQVRKAVLAELSIKPDGGLSGPVSFSENGYGAVEGRLQIREKDVPHFLQQHFKNLLADGSATDYKVEQAENWQEPGLKGSFNFATASNAVASGDKIYLNPTLGFGPRESPFKNPERKFDVDFGTPRSENYSFTFSIPAGYRVEELPKSLKLSFGENALTFDYLCEASAGQLKINLRHAVKKPYIPVDQYDGLRQFFSTLVAKLNEQVVLTKG